MGQFSVLLGEFIFFMIILTIVIVIVVGFSRR